MSAAHVPPQPARPGPGLAKALSRRLPRTDVALVGGRVALLAVAGLVEGMLLANSPVLERYAGVRLGPEGIVVDVTLLCAVVLAAAGAAAALAPWAQAVFLGFVVSTASWSLAESSQHPFWIFSNRGIWRPQPPAAGVVTAHVLAIALVCCAAVAEAMQKYRAAARVQSMSAAALSRDTARLARAGAMLVGATAFVTLPLVAILDGVADDLVGAVRGRMALVLLLASALLLLTGLGLLAAQGRVPKAPPRAPTAAAPSTAPANAHAEK